MIGRREFLRAAGALGLTGGMPVLAAEPPPETTRIRLIRESSICLAPLYIAEELLKTEGFREIQYVPLEGTLGTGQMLGAGKADLGADSVPALILTPEAIRLLKAGRIDAFLGFPPEPQELRAAKIGNVIVDTAIDKPWSQYFCCMAVANRNFAAKNPVADWRFLSELKKELKT